MKGNDEWVWILWVGIGAVVGGVLLYNWWNEKRRRERLMQAALESGFQFEPEGTPLPVEAQLLSDVLSRGRDHQMKNILRGAAGGSEVLLFDYFFTEGSGRNSQTYKQTLAAFRVRGGLPSFKLAPESWWHKLGAAFGYQDIDFDAHPEFSKRYLLRGKDEAAIRQLFHPGLVHYFETLPKHNLNVEGAGEWLLVYELNKRFEPQKLREFADERAQFAAGILGQLSGRMRSFA